jgi:aerobic-type carbon monoxide dehydrogenase small subunit (CoxS/CutS family)
MVKLTINGEQKSFDAPADLPLLWVLRDVLGMTGTKLGCGVEGERGATATVLSRRSRGNPPTIRAR